MPAPVRPVPDSSSVIIPMLYCRDPGAMIEFCKTVFGAHELGRRAGADGTVLHALLMVGGEMIMIDAEFPTVASRAPQLDASSPVVIFMYVENVDQVVERAASAGAQILIPLKNQFWGDRSARIMDPSGHVWTVASRIEETSEPERKQRWADILASRQA